MAFPDPKISMIPAEVEAESLYLEDVSLEEQRIRDKREAFGRNIESKLQDAMIARSASGVEARWTRDLDMYHGVDDVRPTKDNIMGGSRESRGSRRRSRVHVQITRQKTNAAIAHAYNLLFPTEEKNWELEATPVPAIVKMFQENGNIAVIDQAPGPTQGKPLPHPTETMVDPETGEESPRPLLVRDVLGAQMQQARDKAAAMEREIDDQLTECDYGRECLKVMTDAGKLGTGILKGPLVVNRVKKAWVKGPNGYEMQVQEKLVPESRRVDPWDFFPAAGCGDDIKKASYVFERELFTRQQLRELADITDPDGEPLYEIDCLRKILQEGPRRVERSFTDARGRYGNGYVDEGHDPKLFELYTYTGEVLVDDLKCFDVPLDDAELEVAKLNAFVVICNGRVIRIGIDPMESGSIPYDIFVWEPADGSPFGYGIPYLMRYAQVTINAAWRQMQDNAGVSHGPQIVMDPGAVAPANGEMTIHGMKLWFKKGTVPTQDAFQVFQINDNQQSLANIVNFAKTFADEETALPMLAQGEQGTAPDKVGVATLLMNNASVVLKMIARRWDDTITNPHISRYYDWNMQFNESDEIKGDFNVAARGSTALVVRDQKRQDVAMWLQLRQDPKLAILINDKRLIQSAAEMSSLPGILNTIEEQKQIEEQQAKQGQPEDPRIAVAKLRAQTDEKLAQIEAQSEMANIQLKAQGMQMDDERETVLMQLQIEKMIQDNALKMGISEQQSKAKFAEIILKERASQQKANADHLRGIERDATQIGRTVQ